MTTARDILQAHYLSEIESKREKIESGDGTALLSALESVAMSDAAMPDWLATQVVRSIRNYTHHKTTTLDEAFNVKRPDGYRRQAAKDRWNKGVLVVSDVIALIRAGRPVDDGMFEEVGSSRGVGKTTAKKWYYFHKDNHTVTYAALAFAAGIDATKK